VLLLVLDLGVVALLELPEELCDLTVALLLLEVLLCGLTVALLLVVSLLGALTALLLLVALLCGLTVALPLLLPVELCDLTAPLRLLFVDACVAFLFMFCSLVVVERSTALLFERDSLLAGLTVEALLASLLLVVAALLVSLLLVVAALVLGVLLSTLLFLPSDDLLLSVSLVLALRSLDTSGR